MSIVNKVEQELKTEASELMRAANNPAATRPLNPAGNKVLTITGSTSLGDSYVSTPFFDKA